MAICSSVLPGKFYGQKSLVGYSPWDAELDMTEQLSTHSTIHDCLFFKSNERKNTQNDILYLTRNYS